MANQAKSQQYCRLPGPGVVILPNQEGCNTVFAQPRRLQYCCFQPADQWRAAEEPFCGTAPFVLPISISLGRCYPSRQYAV